MREAPQLFARIYARHGHRCPMSTLGGRLGLAAMRRFPGVEQVAAVYSRRTCALDGIAETTGCREDDGTLIIQPDRRHMLTVQSGQTSIALALSDWALGQAGSYRDLCNRLEEGWAMLGATEQARRRAEMDAMLDDLLPRFWQADEHELMTRVE